MALPEDCDVALLPIKPRFAEAILAGTKRVEFRRQGFGRRVSHVLIYASSPVQRVVGFFRIGGIIRDEPERIWAKYHRVAGISESEFLTYYAGSRDAFAIEVDELVVLSRPRTLRAIKRSLRAPQNFLYLDSSILNQLST